MSDVLTPAQRHRNMAAIHSASTKPEIKLRHALWRQGFRYRVNDKRLPGKPDIVLPKYHTVVFIHGCFWHGHKGCKYYSVPKTNTEFWIAKVARNQERDQEEWRQLEAKGWYVIIVWECQLKKSKIEDTIQNVITEIRSNGIKHEQLQAQRKASREAYRQERKAQREKEEQMKAALKNRQAHLLQNSNQTPL